MCKQLIVKVRQDILLYVKGKQVRLNKDEVWSLDDETPHSIYFEYFEGPDAPKPTKKLCLCGCNSQEIVIDLTKEEVKEEKKGKKKEAKEEEVKEENLTEN